MSRTSEEPTGGHGDDAAPGDTGSVPAAETPPLDYATSAAGDSGGGPEPVSLVLPETSSLSARDWLILAAVFLAAVVIRVVYVLQMRDNPLFADPILDGEVHDNWARAILAGERFFDGAYFKAPLYPWMLACVYRVFGPGYLAPRLVQAVMGSASCGLLYLTGREAFGRIVGAVAGFAAATFWVMVYFDGELLLEPLSIFLNLLALWLIFRAARSDGAGGWVLSGLVLGLSAINRPNVLVFMPLVALWIIFRARQKGIRVLDRRDADAPRGWFLRGLSRVGLFGAACLVPILPITIRNTVVGDDFVLIASQGGPNFYIGNNPQADGISARMPGARTSWGGGTQDWITLAEQETGRKLKPSEVSAFFFDKAWDFIRKTPGLALQLTLVKLQMFFHDWEVGNNHDLYFFTDRFTPVVRFLPLTTGMILPLGVFGLLFAAISSIWTGRCIFPLWSFTLVYTATVIAFFVCARFRVPVMPLYILFAAYLVVRCVDFARRQDWLALVGCALIGFLLYWGVNRGWPESLRQRDVARAYTQLGSAYAAAGRDDEARQALRDSLETDPNSIEARAGLGFHHFQQGRYEEAVEHFRAALRLSPGIDVHEPLARALIKLGRWREGIAVLRSGTEDLPHYLDMKRMLAFILATCPDARHRDGREAVRLAEMVRDFGPEIPETYDTLACAYARVGRYDDALRAARKALAIAQRVIHLEALEQIHRHIRQFERRQPFTQ